MNRNNFGMNLDEGIALTSDKEFELLYVEAHADARAKLSEWLIAGNKPLVLGGQIGCGKTTLIQQVFQSKKIEPDLTFHFDKNSIDLSVFDAWMVVFIEILDKCKLDEFRDELPNEFLEFLGKTEKKQKTILSMIKLEKISAESLRMRQELLKIFRTFGESLTEIFKRVFVKVNNINKNILFASGIDKFKVGSAEYTSITPILECLSNFKTLFEVNAVHLFSKDKWKNELESYFLISESEQTIVKILEKRLGKYSQAYVKDIKLIARFSGGNIRQAIRLLDYFRVFQKKEINSTEAFLKSVKSLNRDFFAFSSHPSNELLNQIKRDGFLKTDMLTLPGDYETALKAVFENWVFIGEYRETSTWKAYLNPLIKDSLAKGFPEDPGIAYLKEYAKQNGISDFGLSFDHSSEEAKNFLVSEIEQDISLNISEIMNVLNNALLSKNRKDRVLIAYKNEAILKVTLNYLKAKSNSYEYQIWNHFEINKEQQTSPLEQILKQIAVTDSDIYSIRFGDELSREQLKEFNLRRDYFIDKQMIWWIPENKLQNYLADWTQLRQLFQIIVLEDSLKNNLSVEEIEQDIAFMEEMVEEEKTAEFEYIKNLKLVLEYLREEKND